MMEKEGSVVSFMTYPGQIPMSDDSFSDGNLPEGVVYSNKCRM